MMTLAINDAVPAQRAIRFALQALGSALAVSPSVDAFVTLTTPTGGVFHEHLAILRALTASSSFFGTSSTQSGEVCDVVAWAQGVESIALPDVDKRLATRSFLAGHSLTVADPLVYFLLSNALASASSGLWSKHPGVARWVDQLQHEAGLNLSALETAAVALPARPALDIGKAKEKKGEEKPAAGAGAATAVPVPAAGNAAPAGKSDVDDPVSAMNFVVGVIVDCWKHPESDKLWCEKIDVGEPVPREIASGLQQIFTLKQMKGQRVVIIANLPARKLAGFPSNGMVLCATSADGTVEFIEPPAGAKIGERVTFPGHEGPAAEPNRVVKKKLFEAVATDLHVDGDKKATWKGIPFTTEAGPCTVKSVPAGSLIK